MLVKVLYKILKKVVDNCDKFYLEETNPDVMEAKELLGRMEKVMKEDEEESKDFALSKNEDGTFSVYEMPYATVDCATKENFEYLKDAVEYYRNKEETSKWIPCSERLPEDESYILVSFENSTMADIARYEKNDEGGTFYPGDDEKSYLGYELFVNAWMELPEPYREDE